MAVDDPWAIDGLQLSALEWRRAMSGLLMHDTDPVSARAGVLSGCAVTVASLTATVGAGQVAVTPQSGSNGTYIFGLTATDLAIAAQDATYARIDRVIARIYDNSVDGSGQSKSAVEIITGVPSATPAAPALPAGALELAQLQVPKSGGGAIVVVDRRLQTATTGPVYAPDLATLQTVAPARPGTKGAVGTGATLVEYVWTGTAWVESYLNAPPTAGTDSLATRLPDGTMIVTARVSVPITTAGTPASVALTFPAAFLAGSLPRVSATSFGTTPQTAQVSVASLSATGVTVWGNRTTGTTAIPVDVIAIGRWKA